MARPAKKDRAEVLDAATDLFWRRGYRGVSISDLADATGLLAGSLYASYGNKERIFIDCIQHYAAKVGAIYQAVELGVASPLGKIEALLGRIVEGSLADAHRRGCMVVNALLEIAPDSPAIAAESKDRVAFSESWFAARLDEAKEAGELKPEADTSALAACLFGMVYVIQIKSRARESEERLRQYKDMALRALVDPWRLGRSDAS